MKVARIDDLGGTPNATQAQIDLTADFDWVNDVAWLSGAPGQPRRLAVLGNCTDFVAQEHLAPNETQWWYGDTHHLTGDIKIYDVGQSLAVSELGSASLNHAFDTAWETFSTIHRPLLGGGENLRFHVAGLGSGGFVVQGMANGFDMNGPSSGNYNRLIGFDSTWTQRVAGDGRTSYLGGDNNYDVAGMAVPGDSFYSSIRVRSVTGGWAAGIVSRTHVDWDTGFTIDADLYGSEGGCYYMSAVSPLAAVDGHAMESGVLVSNNGAASYNAPVDFDDQDYLNNTQQWGYKWTSLDETMGIDSEGGGMYAVLRHADTNDLFSLDAVTGDYTDEGFQFTWSGSPWTIVASDGNAMTSVPEPSTLALAFSGLLVLTACVWRRKR